MGKTFIVSRWWRFSITLLAVVIIAVGYILALRIWVDPQPHGRLQDERPVPILAIPAYSQQILWLDTPLPTATYTVLLTAVSGQGETDMYYGLAIGEEDNYLEVTISPLGYAAVKRIIAGEEIPLRPLAPFPHVRGGVQSNEMWVTVDSSSAVIVRLNREVLWQGKMEKLAGTKIAVVGQSYGNAAEVEFQPLQLYYR